MFPKRGTTSFLASVVFPQTGGRTGEVLSRLGECVGRTGEGAVVEGVHAEVSKKLVTFPVYTLFMVSYPDIHALCVGVLEHTTG